MATITKIQRKSGPRFKAIIKDRTGRPINDLPPVTSPPVKLDFIIKGYCNS